MNAPRKTLRLFNPTPTAPAPLRPPVTPAVLTELEQILVAWFRAVGLEATVEIKRKDGTTQ